MAEPGATCSTQEITVRGAIARVALNRPDVHNAFDETLISELTHVARTLDADAGLRVLVLAGRGKGQYDGAALGSISEHLLPGLWAFGVALLACVAAVPLALWLSRRFHVVAQPGGRHAHHNPTPMLGGLAMWVGFAVATLVFVPLDLQTVGILVVSGLAMGLLVLDDKRGMRPPVKLAVQTALAVVAVIGFGIQVKFFSLPGGHIVQLGLLVLP